MNLILELISDARALEPHRAAWDALAVAAAKPFSAPGWLLAWWRHAAPADAQLRVLVVRDNDELVGLAPFFADRGPGGMRRWRPLGAETCQGVEPLARAGAEPAVAKAMAEAMAAQRVDLITFEGVTGRCAWPARLATAWPGRRRPWVGRRETRLAPYVALETGFAGWMARRTGHFRQRVKRNRQELARGGGALRLATPETLDRDLAAFARLHRARWEAEGGSEALTPGVRRMLGEAAAQLPAERLRVWSLELGEETIASSVVLVAGQEAGYWLNGIQRGHSSLNPSRLAILGVIEDAFSLGATRVDLGEGAFEYKQRYADGEDELQWLWFVPPGRCHALNRLRTVPGMGRRVASERLSTEAKDRLRRLAASLKP